MIVHFPPFFVFDFQISSHLIRMAFCFETILLGRKFALNLICLDLIRTEPFAWWFMACQQTMKRRHKLVHMWKPPFMRQVDVQEDEWAVLSEISHDCLIQMVSKTVHLVVSVGTRSVTVGMQPAILILFVWGEWVGVAGGGVALVNSMGVWMSYYH